MKLSRGREAHNSERFWHAARMPLPEAGLKHSNGQNRSFYLHETVSVTNARWRAYSSLTNQNLGGRMETWSVLFISGALCIAGCGASGSHTLRAEFVYSSIIESCQSSAKKSLPHPENARFSQWLTSEITDTLDQPPAGIKLNRAAGDRYYLANGMVNAKNGFGEYVGDRPYTCDAVVNSGNSVYARAYPVRGSD